MLVALNKRRMKTEIDELKKEIEFLKRRIKELEDNSSSVIHHLAQVGLQGS